MFVISQDATEGFPAANVLSVADGDGNLIPTVVSVNPTTGAFTGGTFPAAGDVDGPASATLNAVSVYADTTGKIIKNSVMIVDGSGNVTGVLALTATGLSTLAALTQVGTASINASGAGVTTIGTGGTGAVNIGNATGNTAVTGSLSTTTSLAATTSVTAGTSLTATLGAITATNGNVVLGTAGNKITIAEGANGVSGSGVLVNGAVVISCTSVTANSRFAITRTGVNASTALGELTVTKNAGVGFTVTAKDFTTPGNTVTGDISTFDYSFVN